MSKIAIVGGSLLPNLDGFVLQEEQSVETPFGAPSAPLQIGCYENQSVIFLDRHGKGRRTPPHKINYRANMWALHHLGVDRILGVSLVGGIRADMTPGHFAFPDQLVDYTFGRPCSFFDDDFDFSKHIDFTHPYCPIMHQILVDAALGLSLNFTDDATYAVTQGPRFETVAEVNRIERDGCDIIGMTAMPEAALARELNMRYASIALVGTKAPGRTDGLYVDTQEIQSVIANSVGQMHALLKKVVQEL